MKMLLQVKAPLVDKLALRGNLEGMQSRISHGGDATSVKVVE